MASRQKVSTRCKLSSRCDQTSLYIRSVERCILFVDTHTQPDRDRNIPWKQTKFFTIASRSYVITVSTLLLCILTLTKMMKIVRNRSYTRLILRNSCLSAWVATFALVCMEFVIEETNVLTTLPLTILKRIWVPVVIFPSISLQCYCYWRIFIVVQATNNRVPPRADGSARNDSSWQKIAAFQLLVFIVCVCPLSFYLILLIIKGKQNLLLPEKLTLARLMVLNNLNLIIDPIVFFVVF